MVDMLRRFNMNKENIKKLLSWSGWRKEIPWILFIVLVLLAGYNYYNLRERHLDLLDKECVWNCMAEEYIKVVHEEYPAAVIICNYETKRCLISGTKLPEFQINISELNWNSSN